MELRVLKYFMEIVHEESISGAAKKLHITQPTLSRQVKELEEELGVVLLIRGNRRITLTPEGHLLRKRAEEVLSLVDKTQADFSMSVGPISGDVYIGGGESEAMRLIARAAKSLHQDFPDVKYHLYSGNADDVTEKLDHGFLDFGILIEPADIQKYDYIRLHHKDIWGLLMRKDSPLAGKETIQPTDLLQIPLITSRQTLVKNELSGWLRNDFGKLNTIAQYNLVYNASLMVEEGLGYALCLDKLINTDEHSALCFVPLSPRLEAHMDIVWKKNQVFSKAATEFLNRIQLINQHEGT